MIVIRVNILFQFIHSHLVRIGHHQQSKLDSGLWSPNVKHNKTQFLFSLFRLGNSTGLWLHWVQIVFLDNNYLHFWWFIYMQAKLRVNNNELFRARVVMSAWSKTAHYYYSNKKSKLLQSSSTGHWQPENIEHPQTDTAASAVVNGIDSGQPTDE